MTNQKVEYRCLKCNKIYEVENSDASQNENHAPRCSECGAELQICNSFQEGIKMGIITFIITFILSASFIRVYWWSDKDNSLKYLIAALGCFTIALALGIIRSRLTEKKTMGIIYIVTAILVVIGIGIGAGLYSKSINFRIEKFEVITNEGTVNLRVWSKEKCSAEVNVIFYRDHKEVMTLKKTADFNKGERKDLTLISLSSFSYETTSVYVNGKRYR